MIGRILRDRYKILYSIGSGGMARVYLAQDMRQERQVAIKILHPQFNEDPAFIQRFQREATLASALNDSHIVRVLEYGVEDDLHFLVMEYVEGPNLHQLIKKKGAFKWPAALRTMSQLIGALAHAHSHGVIHRDIKPQNMILTQEGLLKVLDFGIARIPALPALTQTGAIIGSPQYVSPEQVRGKEVGFASDIYSAGLVLYELLSGTSLFEGESAWSIIGYYINHKPLPLKLPANEIPAEVLTLLNRMLARQAEDRPQAATLRQEIEAILALPAEPAVKDKPSSARTTPRRAKFNRQEWQHLGQLGLLFGGAITVICLLLLNFGTQTWAFEEEAKIQLKSLYEEAHLDIEKGDISRAITKLDQILEEDPDYADVALWRQDLSTTLLASAPATPEAEISPDSPEEALDALLARAQDDISQERWAEAIAALKDATLSLDSEYQQARVAAVLCDAYLGQGLAGLVTAAAAEADEKRLVRRALADFEAGVAVCPRRTDLRNQAEQASAYLRALAIPWYGYEVLIQTLTPLVATAPDYMEGRAKESLYQAYLRRAQARQVISEPIAAILADYEAALALRVADPAEAQTRRARLLQAVAQPFEAEVNQEVDQPAPAAPKLVPAPSPDPVKYTQPVLMEPHNDAIFAGRFAETYLGWAAPGELAVDEYYDVTIMHLFAGEPRYLGSLRTRETRIRIGPEIGVGQAANDRFYWWVTIRKDQTASAPGSLDLPLSPQSEARTFIWGS